MSDDVEDRVTMTHSVGDDSMPAELQAKLTLTRQKDPKKVAAGKAGAAARKAKQERLLEELRAAKQSLRPESDAVHVPSQEQKDPFPKPNDTAATQSVTDTQCQKNWTPFLYTIGIAAGVFSVYMLRCHRQDQKPLAVPLQACHTKRTKNPVEKTHQLKVSHDPFYME